MQCVTFYFNPLPRKEGDLDSGSYVGSGTISIHSLVKRETIDWLTSGAIILISIHSLVKRETVAICTSWHLKANFNPLPRKEGDFLTSLPFLSRFDFNPLPRKEGDNRERRIYVCPADFNPLPRKEGDMTKKRPPARGRRYFNPLPRKEGDKVPSFTANATMNFNPLPRKEGDAILWHGSPNLILFQSTPS